jgi:2-dehydro-3-deoxyphosphogluconate aldolase/(4S)-4-hydroxy-2-oxoglutarate aldolase
MFSKDELPILGILRGISEKHIDPLLKVFSRSGIKYIEITMNTQGATRLLKEIVVRAERNLVVGAGTVLSKQVMFEAVAAGARFIVSPSVVEDVILECVEQNIPVFPGAFTPTEVHKAWNMGATMVKLFPSGMFGPNYIKALKGPFENIKIMAVGGIDEQNISLFFKQGADAVAFGAGILRSEWMNSNRFDLIDEKLQLLIKAYLCSID